MAPSTRARKQPVRRVIHDPPPARGSRHNPFVLEETPEPVEEVQAPPASSRKPKRGPVPHIKAAAIFKPKAQAQAKAQPKMKLPLTKRECSICATTKSVSHSFRLSAKSEVCKHFQDVCGLCIQKMLKTKIADRKLSEPDLACPLPKCDHGLDTVMLKQACINKELVGQYEQALVKHHLSANPNYIVCLSSTCGAYFSIEDCQGDSRRKRTTKHKAACPHCEYALCLTCNRPWHGNTGCDKAKQKEDADSVEEIKTMGAKPCPKCGLNIDKEGGCDHMTCSACRHNFCWECLVPYQDPVQHAPGCTHGRRDVAVDPRNWVQDNMTDAQINNLIAQAHGPHGRPAARPLPAVMAGVPNAIPNGMLGIQGQAQLAPGAPWFPPAGGFGFGWNVFNGMFGGGAGGG
ncbi:hypothetical protein CC86DRAFT_384256 [Ophiobolus disseminans]|uniref:RBR-type E3 ubiquitin transferase n=1 Tax=Ophiobolus disseminans TaxID=1469910 RepID=A0A6A6ZSD3_9PLEO|nr:hypothetical protein CC86DRAFT_384256 [Ophiobolus disseminans]